jgi:SLT domain-containing protein
MSNSYEKALKFVQMNPGTSGSVGLAKLILSLYNDYHCYGISECLGPLDNANTELALAMIRLYAANQERDALNAAGRWVYEKFPRLAEQSQAMQEARQQVRAGWDREAERLRAEEERHANGED